MKDPQISKEIKLGASVDTQTCECIRRYSSWAQKVILAMTAYFD